MAGGRINRLDDLDGYHHGKSAGSIPTRQSIRRMSGSWDTTTLAMLGSRRLRAAGICTDDPGSGIAIRPRSGKSMIRVGALKGRQTSWEVESDRTGLRWPARGDSGARFEILEGAGKAMRGCIRAVLERRRPRPGIRQGPSGRA